MTYQETLDWMYGQLPMYQQFGTHALGTKLDKTVLLAEHLGNPQEKFKSLHVAGTNGKGSSSHMLASILQEAGYTVGLYTSPHLKDFRERIKINGIPVSKQYVMEFVQQNRSFITENSLSFFEMTVGMAFAFFAKKQVDIAVVEVGLGGRLDSTNILTPEVSLITNIGWDHTAVLGDTLPDIAREKAGIIKEGVPVVVSERQEEVASVFKEISKLKHSKLVFAEDVVKKEYQTDLKGDYQKKNVKGVVATIRELQGYRISENNLVNGLMHVVSNTGLLGRWQELQTKPRVLCDTAHNQAGLALVVEQINRESFDTLHLVLGFVRDKDLENVLPLFPQNAHYYFAKPNLPRGLDATILQQKAQEYGLRGAVYNSVELAYQSALRAAKQDDLIFIGGSTFVVAEVL